MIVAGVAATISSGGGGIVAVVSGSCWMVLEDMGLHVRGSVASIEAVLADARRHGEERAHVWTVCGAHVEASADLPWEVRDAA